MGIYINRGNDNFHDIRNSEYVDKTGMIAEINKTLNTERRFTCLTRCRRFGKSMAAEMLCAYYDKSCDSRALFEGLSIATPDKMVNGKMEDKQFEKHRNKYPVLYRDVTDFTTRYKGDASIVSHIQAEIKEEILTTYPDVIAKRSNAKTILPRWQNMRANCCWSVSIMTRRRNGTHALSTNALSNVLRSF